MSLAMSATPERVWMPATAQLLLPGATASSRAAVGGAGESQLRGKGLREHAARSRCRPPARSGASAE